ncbi:MAG: haloacid dehalogenase-like hydrolase, partial [Achromobacter piechaudii]
MSDVIALIFDFDDTLASDSTSGFLESIGVDTASFWKDEVDPLLSKQDWDPVPAYLYKMIQLSQAGTHGLITQQRLKEWGARLDLHVGVPTLVQRLRAAV